ncbi:hypothetical protein Krac_5919 [Ktedonobacter racemifer DSM 44963]|uniref:Uncharacterized protein n=1 Tax=Ktedonobacter racemifer DSM 44963 TaxID=485913 RepID=D6TX78_KTERA|nr:hypothetical protein Krac_5919 [Ktedonobacter racemifer DSM 44963]
MQKKRITFEIVVAYSQCPQKAFFLLCTDEQGTPHEYRDMLDQQKDRNGQITSTHLKYISNLLAKSPCILEMTSSVKVKHHDTS